MTDWKQATETLREIKHNHSIQREGYDAAIRLCELAAKLPAGEAERVLEQEWELRRPRRRPCPSNMCDMAKCNACDGDGWVTR